MSIARPIIRSLRRTDIAAAAGQTVFGFAGSTPIWATEDVAVFVKAAGAARFSRLTSGFTVTLAGEAATVTFASAPRPAGSGTAVTVRLESRRLDERTDDMTRAGAIRSALVEKRHDQLATLQQEMRRDIDDLTQPFAGQGLAGQVVTVGPNGDLTPVPAGNEVTSAAYLRRDGTTPINGDLDFKPGLTGAFAMARFFRPDGTQAGQFGFNRDTGKIVWQAMNAAGVWVNDAITVDPTSGAVIIPKERGRFYVSQHDGDMAIQNAATAAGAVATASNKQVVVLEPGGAHQINGMVRAPDHVGIAVAHPGARIDTMVRNIANNKGSVVNPDDPAYNNADFWFGNGSWFAGFYVQTTGSTAHDTFISWKKYGGRFFALEPNYPQTNLVPDAGFGKARGLYIRVPDTIWNVGVATPVPCSFLGVGGLFNRYTPGLANSEIIRIEGAGTNSGLVTGANRDPKDVWLWDVMPDDYGMNDGTSGLIRVVGVPDVHICRPDFGMADTVAANAMIVDKAVGQTGNLQFVQLLNPTFRGDKKIYVGAGVEFELQGGKAAKVVHNGALLQAEVDGIWSQLPGPSRFTITNAFAATSPPAATLDTATRDGTLVMRKGYHGAETNGSALSLATFDQVMSGSAWSVTGRLRVTGSGGSTTFGGIFVHNADRSRILGIVLRRDRAIECVNMYIDAGTGRSMYNASVWWAPNGPEDALLRIRGSGSNVLFEMIVGDPTDNRAIMSLVTRNEAPTVFTRAAIGCSAEGGLTAVHVKDWAVA